MPGARRGREIPKDMELLLAPLTYSSEILVEAQMSAAPWLALQSGCDFDPAVWS